MPRCSSLFAAMLAAFPLPTQDTAVTPADDAVLLRTALDRFGADLCDREADWWKKVLGPEEIKS